MSETSLNTGEMLFQLRVWDYLAWALDDKRLDHVENLYYKGRPISVSTFANPNVPMVKCFDKAELLAGDIDSEYPFVIQADGMFDADVMDEREWIASQTRLHESERVGQVRDSATGQTVCGMR